MRASEPGCLFEEGDALHPQSNIEKMKAGHPLTDDDRWPWLEKVAERVEERLDAGENGSPLCTEAPCTSTQTISVTSIGSLHTGFRHRREEHAWRQAS